MIFKLIKKTIGVPLSIPKIRAGGNFIWQTDFHNKFDDEFNYQAELFT